MYSTVFISTFSDPNQDQNIRFLFFVVVLFYLPNHTSQGTNPDYSYMSRMFQQKIHCWSLYPIHGAKGVGRRGKKLIPLKEQNQIILICQECSNKKTFLVALPHTWGKGHWQTVQNANRGGLPRTLGAFPPLQSTKDNCKNRRQRIVQKGSTFLSKEQRKNDIYTYIQP